MNFLTRFLHDPQEYWQLVKLHRNVQLVHVLIASHKLKKYCSVSCLVMLFNNFSTLDNLAELQVSENNVFSCIKPV